MWYHASKMRRKQTVTTGLKIRQHVLKAIHNSMVNILFSDIDDHYHFRSPLHRHRVWYAKARINNCLKNLFVTPMCHVYPLHCVTTTINSQLMPQSIKYKCWEHNHDQADEANITFSFWFQRFLCHVIWQFPWRCRHSKAKVITINYRNFASQLI